MRSPRELLRSDMTFDQMVAALVGDGYDQLDARSIAAHTTRPSLVKVTSKPAARTVKPRRELTKV